MCVLKQFWIDHGLDSVSDGGLGSFKLYIMCIHLLTHTNVPASLADVLVAFFEFYSVFDSGSIIQLDGISADFSSIGNLHGIQKFSTAARTFVFFIFLLVG